MRLPQWVPYVLVSDVAASTEKAKSLGATVLEGVTEIPDMGWFSMLRRSDRRGLCIVEAENARIDRAT